MFPSLFVLDRDIIDLIQISLYIPSNYDLFSSKVSLSFFFFVIFLFEYCCTLSFKSFFFKTDVLNCRHQTSTIKSVFNQKHLYAVLLN